MSRRYHINPELGTPSICRAEHGNCPYGGASGSENHFDTYSEAQKYSQEIFEKTYRLLPVSIEQDPSQIMKEIEERKKVKRNVAKELTKGSIYEETKSIMYSDDEDIVMGVIEGEIYEDRGWKYTSVALQNPNVSREFMDEALFKYPKAYDISTRRWLVLNQSLSHEELLSIIENEDEDMTMRAIAFRNPNINKEYVNNIIKNDIDRLEKLPYSMIAFSQYANDETEKVKDDALFFRTRPLQGLSLAEDMFGKYHPWDYKYRKEIKEEKES